MAVLHSRESDRTSVVAAADLPSAPCRRCSGDDPGELPGGFCFCSCHEARDREFAGSLDPPVESIDELRRLASDFTAAAADAAVCNAVVAQAAAASQLGEAEEQFRKKFVLASGVDARRVLPKSKVKFPDDRNSLLNTIPYCVPYVATALALYALFIIVAAVRPLYKIVTYHVSTRGDPRSETGKQMFSNSVVPTSSEVVFPLVDEEDYPYEFCSRGLSTAKQMNFFIRVLCCSEEFLPTLWLSWCQLLFCILVHLWVVRHHLFHLVRQKFRPYDVAGEFTLDETSVEKTTQYVSALQPQSPLNGRYGFVNLKGHIRQILALINPTSGGRMAMTYYQQLILPELLLLFGSDTKVLPIVLDEKNEEFVCAFIHRWSHVFDLCLILGGDGSYHSIVNLLIRAGLEKRHNDSGDDEGPPNSKEAPAGEGLSPGFDSWFDSNRRRSTVWTRKCHSCRKKKCIFPIDLPISPVPLGTSNTWCSEFVFSYAGPIAAKCYAANARQAAAATMEQLEREKAKLSRRDSYHFAHPEQTSTDEGLELVSSETENKFQNKKQTSNLRDEEGKTVSLDDSKSSSFSGTQTTSRMETCDGYDSDRGCVSSTSPSLSTEFVDPAPPAASQSLYQAIPGICDSSKYPSVAAQAAARAAVDVAALARTEASFAASNAGTGAFFRDCNAGVKAEEAAVAAEVACDAAARVAKATHIGGPGSWENLASPSCSDDACVSKRMDECPGETERTRDSKVLDSEMPAARIVASLAALHRNDSADLAECSRLLAPAPTPELKGVRLAKHHLRVAKMMDELATKMGPGKDKNMMQLGRESLLHFWMRRLQESRTTRINALLVEAGGERHICCNSLEFGFIGTAQVHSEDTRWTGHMRYTLAFLYQLLMRRTFPAYITATLPNNEVVHRIGDYMVVALDVIQHWTDDRPVARQAQMDGPCAWLLLMNGEISRARLWAYTSDLRRLSMAEEKGLEMLPVKRVHIKLTEPGIYGLDGEVYRHGGELTFTMLPGPIRVCVSEFDQLIAHPAGGHRWMKCIRRDLTE
uniref:Putative transmembrane protein n=1 Tax=Toxoplasma gondii COUG TaxID=1074873 RepID=A0A2G8XSG2_TOXGO|nr:putative transmembrane protein [Toxoplasma gondii COUG]